MYPLHLILYFLAIWDWDNGNDKYSSIILYFSILEKVFIEQVSIFLYNIFAETINQ